MSHLPTPLRDLQRAPLNEAGVQRLWRRIGDERARASRPASRVAWAGFAFGAAVLALALVWGLSTRRPPAAGPLLLAGGAEITELEANADGPPVLLADGSTITLHPGTHLHALESTATEFSVLVRAGAADFMVKKGGPRRWIIECGLATVEVVGTRFTIERGEGKVRIEVTEGVVLVRGERVPDRVQRLVDGERLEITDAGAGEHAGAPKEDSSVAEPLGSSAPPPSAAPPAAPAWRDLARRGDYKEAYRALGQQGIAEKARGSSVDDLLMLADVARLSGHSAEAVAPLSRLVDEHAGDARAALAAFTLGRIELDSLGRPAAAANAFTRALSLGLSASLVEDARARIVEARARAGDRKGARAAADDYERRFPGGHHLAAVRRWVAEPSTASSAKVDGG